MSLKDLGRTPGEDDLHGLLQGGNSYRKARPRRGWGLRVAGPVVIICAVLAMLVVADYSLNSGKIYWGVEAGTVPLGGKTPAEAREAVRDRTTGALTEFDFSGPEDFEFSAEEMGVNFDVDATVEQAYAVGRQGSILERLSERAQGLYGTVTVSPVVEYQPEVARDRVESLAEQLNRQPEEAAVEVYGSEVQVFESSEGYEMNVAETFQNVDRAVEDMTSDVKIVGRTLKPEVVTAEAEKAAEKARPATAGQLVLNSEDQRWVLSPADVGSALDVTTADGEVKVSLNRDRVKERLESMYADLTVEPVEAGYEVKGNRISVTPSQTGKSIEEDKLMQAIEQGIFEGQREYQVPVVTADPELATAEAEALMPTDLLGSYRTNYAIVPDNGDRKENLEIASKAVNGTLVAPEEIFSMNEHVMGLDYNATKVIIDGAETKADGGGLCQVTSTLYNAANFAGLDVVERYPHHSQLPYIRPGMDATVWFGDGYGNGELDMKFRNTTDGYLLLRQYVDDDGYIYADVYGRPNGMKVQMSSKPVYMGADYSKWVTYQKVTKNGQVVRSGRLHTDVYNPLVDYKGKVIKPSEVYVPPVRQ